MKNQLLSLSYIIIVIHAALSANRMLNKKLLSLLIHIVYRLLNDRSRNQNKQSSEFSGILNLHIMLKILKNNGLIIEEKGGAIFLNEKINYLLNDLISDREHIYVWRLAYEIAKLSEYTIAKIANYLKATEESNVDNLEKEESEIISELISIIESKARYLSS